MSLSVDPTFFGRIGDCCASRKRVGIAWRQLSYRRVSHSVMLSVTEEVECCMPPCSSNRRRNWCRTWLAMTHPATLERAIWSKDLTCCGEEARVAATRTGMIQKRAQCCVVLSPRPHATHGGRLVSLFGHASGTENSPRSLPAIGCQGELSGMPHMSVPKRVVASMLLSWQHFSHAGPKLSPRG